MEKKTVGNVVTFIIALQRHMEMEFGYQGRNFHINFTSDETESMSVEEIANGQDKGFYGEYESIEELFANCVIDGVSFEEMLFNFDYIYA